MYEVESSFGGGALEYILDTYDTYDFGWSPFKLASSQTDCLIVRESGGNTLATIGFDAFDNLDQSAIAAHCGANDGFVRVLISPNGNNATQTNNSWQAKIYDGATGLVLLDSAGNPQPKYTRASFNYYVFSTPITQPIGYSVFWTMTRTSESLFRGIYGGNSFSKVGAGMESSGSIVVIDCTQGGRRYSAPALNVAEMHVNYHTASGLSNSLYRSNAVPNTDIGNVTRIDTDAADSIGRWANNYFEGGIGTFINFPSGQLANIEAIETALNDKLNIY
jgi:hypothetical protein